MEHSSRLELIRSALEPSSEVQASALTLVRTDSGCRVPPEALVKALVTRWVDSQMLRGATCSEGQDKAFLSWVEERMSRPFLIEPYTVQQAVLKYGAEVTNEFIGLRWEQEVAWAHMMRASDNSRIIFLAAIWLNAARLNPARAFLEMLGEFKRTGEQNYRGMQELLAAPDEIYGQILDGAWRPMWVRHAERHFGARVSRLRGDPSYLSVVKTARDDALSLIIRKRAQRTAERVVRLKPTHSLIVWRKAVTMGLPEHSVLSTFEAFLESIRAGRTVVSKNPILQFAAYMTLSPVLSQPEADDELPEFYVTRHWRAGLPDDLRRLLHGTRGGIEDWEQSLPGRVVRDHVLDLALFTVARSMEQLRRASAPIEVTTQHYTEEALLLSGPAVVAA